MPNQYDYKSNYWIDCCLQILCSVKIATYSQYLFFLFVQEVILPLVLFTPIGIYLYSFEDLSLNQFHAHRRTHVTSGFNDDVDTSDYVWFQVLVAIVSYRWDFTVLENVIPCTTIMRVQNTQRITVNSNKQETYCSKQC